MLIVQDFCQPTENRHTNSSCSEQQFNNTDTFVEYQPEYNQSARYGTESNLLMHVRIQLRLLIWWPDNRTTLFIYKSNTWVSNEPTVQQHAFHARNHAAIQL